MPLDYVLREHGTAQPIGRVVGPLHRFVLGLEGRNDGERAKDFFAVNLHVVFYVGEHGRRDEESLSVHVLLGFATACQRRAFGLATLDVAEDPLVLRLCDLWALERGILEWISDFADLLDPFLEKLDEFVVDAFLDQDAGGRGADLTHVGHDADMAPLDGLVEIGVVEDEQG